VELPAESIFNPLAIQLGESMVMHILDLLH